MYLNQLQNPHNFSPSTIPDLTNKTIIITGGNAGIGLETVLALSLHSPAKIYLACRTESKFSTALTTILARNPDASKTVRFLPLDLNSFVSIKTAADQIIRECDRVDILINNAGIMGAPAGVTVDGYEVHFGVNYLGHALLTKLLLPLLLKTAKREDVPKGGVRVINVSSGAGWALLPKHQDGIDLEAEKSDRKDYHPFWLYSISKLAQIVETREYSRRYPDDGVTFIVVHPGRVQTGLLDGFFGRSRWNYMALFQRFFDWVVGPMTVEKGAWTQLWAATAGLEEMENGGLYTPCGVRVKGSKWCVDDGLGERLWDWTEAELKGKGYL